MQRTHVTFDPSPAQARAARHHVVSVCQGLGSDVVEIAQLLTSELFANAIEHGGGSVGVETVRTDGWLRIEVHDEGEDLPILRRVDDDRTRGRGLLLIERLAVRWGVSAKSDGAGKTVWFVLETR